MKKKAEVKLTVPTRKELERAERLWFYDIIDDWDLGKMRSAFNKSKPINVSKILSGKGSCNPVRAVTRQSDTRMMDDYDIDNIDMYSRDFEF